MKTGVDSIAFDERVFTEEEMQGLLIGNRIPKDYFVTKGKGDNIMTYSSILPAIAKEIEKPARQIHGSVMETIMACADAEQGERATAGIIYGWLYDRLTEKKYGGLVCEYNGNIEEETVKKQLRASLEELYINGFSDDYHLDDIKIITESFVPQKRFGTALVALCFTNYLYPIIGRA